MSQNQSFLSEIHVGTQIEIADPVTKEMDKSRTRISQTIQLRTLELAVRKENVEAVKFMKENKEQKRALTKRNKEYVIDKLRKELEEDRTVLAKRQAVFKTMIDLPIHLKYEAKLNSITENPKNEAQKKVAMAYDRNEEKSKQLHKLVQTRNKIFLEQNMTKLDYLNNLDDIKGLWIQYKTGNIQKDPELSPEEQKLQEKLKNRQERMKLVAFILERFIAGDEKLWGKNPHTISTLAYCDMANSNLPLDEMKERLEKIEQMKEMANKRQPTSGPMTSTPLVKKRSPQDSRME